MFPLKKQRRAIRSLCWWAFTTALLASLCIDPCQADEVSQPPIHTLSANGVFIPDIEPYHVAPFPIRRFTIQQAGTVIHRGEITTHRRSAFISDSGEYFVLHDLYDGLAIYEATGRCIRELTSSDLLDLIELYRRPGRWPCHPEGRWNKEHSTVSFLPDGKSFAVETYNGRTIVIDLATGRMHSNAKDVRQYVVVGVVAIVGVWIFVKWRQSK